jgi:peroxiredoxin
MSLTPSTMLPLGTTAPNFSLPNAVNDSTVCLADFDSAKALLVMFICNHCPYVVHIRQDFGPLADEFAEAGLKVVAINTNDLDHYPQDGPPHMKSLAQVLEWNFPYLMDEDQSVARAYQAACTPDFFLFDGQNRLVYRGQWDDSSPGNNEPVNGVDMRAAIRSVLKGETVNIQQRPAMGCNIKWKAGNFPVYVD